MKKIVGLAMVLMLSFLASCKEDFLDEKTPGFLSSSNAFVTYSDFNASIYNLYNRVRAEFYNSGERRPFDYIYGTDLVYDGQRNVERHSNMVAAYAPRGGLEIPLNHWSSLYKTVSEANTVLNRIPASEMTDSQKTLVEAQAKFFRALAYRTLAYLFGGVPLVVEEITTPRFNFTRATKEEVLKQVISDLVFSAANLPSISDVRDGEISNLAANHLLSEVYLAAGQFQNAADAATAVIGSGDVNLMQNRFGSKSTVTPGDVYWDLFQQGNQNRTSAGNREGIWVIQFETDVIGGGSVSTGTGGSYQAERHFAPQFNNLRIPGRGGSSPILYPRSDLSGGRGIGWGISTKYFSDVIWESDFNNDIRNANHNFVREFMATNPAHPLFGQVISTQNPPAGVTVPHRFLYAFPSKITTPGDHPENLFQDRSQLLLKATAGGTYADQYMFRLAETYLLRAEAYLGLGDLTKAAEDINVVRARAEANPVAPGDVTIDYILDERMRELGLEEKRRLTLMRLGKWYDRVSRFNPYYSDALPHYNLWPIPDIEIERNKDAVLEQNPGYF
ncbi:RagB/SusD family nutrient uptake outer membrane protein [Pontibacter sp. SGAir0037]|uniref:RagB/SusD family nutrient uptake outer membrane protein n=1 Tax=Pontibacter sp. SGAir0037 TaxID=2571030 RepID=UPI0010CCFAEE|nr:RagB/SusD family nutrient uptake outer membrane protein [Pontibacter sp. SGAir0037]QCR24644.1 RagB/SusD family nutrient uptake outer membrane protein [Pontibacter sp. SGAir0037]